MLAIEARKKDWTKSFLIKDILVGWYNFRTAKAKIENVADAAEELE